VRARLEKLRLFVTDNQPLAWSPDGRALYFSAGADSTQDIWSLTVDPASLRVIGGPTRLTTGPEMDLVPVVSRSRGTLAFGHISRSIRVTLLDLDAGGRRLTGRRVAVTPSDVDALLPALSMDGQKLAFVVENPGGHTTELHEITLGSRARRTLRVADNRRGETLFGPRWSRDGTRIAYSFREFDPPPLRSSIRVLDLRSGEESLVTSHITTHIADNPWDWSSDGRSILGGGTRYLAERFALVRLPLSAAPSAERAAQVLVSSRDATMWQAQESPDGRWICYNGLPAGNTDSAIYVIPATGGAPTALTETTGWYDKPRWSGDGRLIYFLALHDGLFNVWGMPFDSMRGRAAGPAFQITHYLGPEEVIAGANELGEVELGVAGRELAVSTKRLSGAIWATDSLSRP
jgi:Tol biopolymer transport system component